jgi:hypothetical protein
MKLEVGTLLNAGVYRLKENKSTNEQNIWLLLCRGNPQLSGEGHLI